MRMNRGTLYLVSQLGRSDCLLWYLCGGVLALLLKQVREGLNGVDPYFTKLADAMVTWIEAWTEINSKSAKVTPPVKSK